MEPDWNDWARQGLERGADCPDEETLRRWIETGASDSRPQGVGAHVSACSRCRLEAEEMAAFFADPGDEVRNLEDSLRRFLAAGAGAQGDAARLEAPHRRGRFIWLAAAAAVLLLVSLALWRDRAPEIPSSGEIGGPVRGGAGVTLLDPLSRQASIPDRLAWRPRAGEVGPWEVRLERVDGSLLWSSSVDGTEVSLPATVLGSLRPGSTYLWRVTGPQGGTATGSFEIARDATGGGRE